MEKTALKEEFDRLMKIKGEVKGVALKSEMDFVLNEEGQDGLERLENTMREAGYSLKRSGIRGMKLYPLGAYGGLQLVIKDIFDYGDRKIQEMGAFEAKMSFIMRLFMRYFVSVKTMANQVPNMWRAYFTVGDLSVAELNEEKKYIISRLENFKIHRIQCNVLVGYFPSVVKMVVGSETSCKETKCPFWGDDYHEFLVKW